MNSSQDHDAAQESRISSPLLWPVGLMGSGKSSVGQILMETYGFQGIDMDALIEERAGMPISKIFEKYEQSGFRVREQAIVKELADTKFLLPTVIATGGGAPCFFDNMQVMNGSGITVFLDGDIELLAQRTLDDEAKGKSVRPLVKGMSLADRIKEFNRLDKERRRYYEQSKVIISLGEKSVGEIVEEILKKCS